MFQRSGLDLTVVQDDLLNDPDSGDAGDNWSEVELHDLMEARFDRFANTLQWQMYGVIVPRFGDPSYNSGYYGTMFDWGGWQTGDTYFRQGCALAEEATRGRESARSTTRRRRRTGCSSRPSSTRSATPGTCRTPGSAARTPTARRRRS